MVMKQTIPTRTHSAKFQNTAIFRAKYFIVIDVYTISKLKHCLSVSYVAIHSMDRFVI
jgi:hypothetical protein